MAEGEGVQSDAEGVQSGTGESTTDGSTSTTSSDGTQSGAESRTSTDPDLERRAAEADSLRERMRAADQRAANFEKELKQLRDKDLPEAEKLKRDFEESQSQVTELQKVNNELALKVAFLSDNTYSWHNPDRAMKLVDLSQVQIGADGTVSGLKEALKALATSDSYLIKQEVKEEPKTPPGTSPGNNGKSSTNGANPAGLPARFPVMRTRMRPN
jgi:predicted RNase H-like nuclease (RuvC/YqgF family)